MKVHAGAEIQLHPFATCVADGSERSGSPRGHFTSWDRVTGTHLVGRWVGPRVGLRHMQKRNISCNCREFSMVVQLGAQSYTGHAKPTPGLLFGRKYIPLVHPLAWIKITGGREIPRSLAKCENHICVRQLGSMCLISVKYLSIQV
jgi:hypothetical protein